MGQYWRYVNVDKFQRTRNLGKMGEFFYDDVTAFIILKIAVPVDNSATNTSEGGSWAGDRILCIGDYIRDWPEKILQSGSSVMKAEEFYNKAKEIERPNIRQCVPYTAYPSDRTWVLRNLDKKVYIRYNGFPKMVYENRKYVVKYDEEPSPFAVPGLGTVLLSRIGWSEDPSCAITWRHAGSLSEGEWAGDRVDVRLFDDTLKEELATGGWFDETDKEVKRQKDIWKSDNSYGW